MVKGGFTIITALAVLVAAFLLFNPVDISPPVDHMVDISEVDMSEEMAGEAGEMIAEAGPMEPPVITMPAAANAMQSGATMPPSVKTVLRSGTLIVISKASQHMYVFVDGKLWDSSPVSTGKPGHDTPVGIFPILQKKVRHFSNIYRNAPMPHMQRLTWGGIAIHAGKLPGYPASHGCIRLPAEFARALYQVTGKGTTTVVVTNHRLESDDRAMRLAINMPVPRPGQRGHLIQRPEPTLAQLMVSPGDTAPSLAQAPQVVLPKTDEPKPETVAIAQTPATRVRGQTIQLAAPPSESEAEAYWLQVRARHPEIAGFEKAIIPATVRSRQVYRLRVTGPGANAACLSMRRSGTDCFPVK